MRRMQTLYRSKGAHRMASDNQGLLAGKNALIMGVANRWSIAYAIGEAMKHPAPLKPDSGRCVLGRRT